MRKEKNRKEEKKEKERDESQCILGPPT